MSENPWCECGKGEVAFISCMGCGRHGFYCTDCGRNYTAKERLSIKKGAIDMSEKMKHTAGPWTMQDSERMEDCFHIVADEDNIAYQVGGLANARLIAAAPELLEALKLADAALELCRQKFRDDGDLTLWNHFAAPEVIKKAIAKATGAE